MNFQKGLTAAALALVLATGISTSTAQTADAQATVPTVISANDSAAAASNTITATNGGEKQADGSTIFRGSKQVRAGVVNGPEPTFPTYFQRPGENVRTYAEQVPFMAALDLRLKAECKTPTPFNESAASWEAFCDSLPKPDVSYFEVLDLATMTIKK
jgi:hypothetical protein